MEQHEQQLTQSRGGTTEGKGATKWGRMLQHPLYYNLVPSKSVCEEQKERQKKKMSGMRDCGVNAKKFFQLVGSYYTVTYFVQLLGAAGYLVKQLGGLNNKQ